MSKKKPKAPVAPDPVQTAAAQTQMNKDTAQYNANLNRINQYTPEGSLEFNVIGTNPDGSPKYESRQTYSPGEQQNYQNQLNVSNALSGLAGENVSRVRDAQSKPFDYSGSTPMQTSIKGAGQGIQSRYNSGGPVQYGYDQGGAINRGYDAGGDIQRSFAGGGNIQDTYASGGDIQRTYGSGGEIQKGIDYSGLGKLPGQGDYGAEAKRVADNLYSQATSRLDPQIEQQQRQLGAQLIGKGVSENSEAYRRAMDQFTRQKTDAYNQANYSAIGAGGAEQSRLFGLAMQGRQQGAHELEYGGEFANKAQAQGESQNAARAAFGNTAQGQAEAQNAARAAFGNTAQGQRFGQNQAMAQFGNEAQQQANQQNQEQAMFGNAAQYQQNAQNAAQADYYNSAQQQANSQNAAQAAFGNTAQGQRFGQNQANADFNNTARANQNAEASYLRGLPLNELNALTNSAGGVNAPAFENYANVSAATPDYAGMVQNNFTNQQALYQQQMQARNAGLGSIFGLAGSLGSAALTGGAGSMASKLFSDRRLKHDVKAIGKLPNGLTTYVFSYLGSKLRQFGVMADEVLKVIPDAVIMHPSGYMMVDYRKVW